MTDSELHFSEISNRISDLCSMSIVSAKIRKIVVLPKSPSEKMGYIRPQLHVMLQSPPGLGKSDIFSDIVEFGKTAKKPTFNIKLFDMMSQAGLVGTIDKNTGKLIPGTMWEARKGTLLIDEMGGSNTSYGFIEAFLSATEKRGFSKKMGFSGPSERIPDEDLILEFKDGWLQCRTRLSAIINSMYEIDKRADQAWRALISRVVPVHFSLTNDELYSMVCDGSKLFNPINYYENLKARLVKLGTTKDVVILPYDECKKLALRVKVLYVNPSIYLRAWGDLCRIYAIKGYHDEKLYDYVLSQKSYYWDTMTASIKAMQRRKYYATS